MIFDECTSEHCSTSHWALFLLWPPKVSPKPDTGSGSNHEKTFMLPHSRASHADLGWQRHFRVREAVNGSTASWIFQDKPIQWWLTRAAIFSASSCSFSVSLTSAVDPHDSKIMGYFQAVQSRGEGSFIITWISFTMVGQKGRHTYETTHVGHASGEGHCGVCSEGCSKSMRT